MEIDDILNSSDSSIGTLEQAKLENELDIEYLLNSANDDTSDTNSLFGTGPYIDDVIPSTTPALLRQISKAQDDQPSINIDTSEYISKYSPMTEFQVNDPYFAEDNDLKGVELADKREQRYLSLGNKDIVPIFKKKGDSSHCKFYVYFAFTY